MRKSTVTSMNPRHSLCPQQQHRRAGLVGVGLITMSFRPAIPRRVASQQSPLPLYRLDHYNIIVHSGTLKCAGQFRHTKNGRANLSPVFVSHDRGALLGSVPNLRQARSDTRLAQGRTMHLFDCVLRIDYWRNGRVKMRPPPGRAHFCVMAIRAASIRAVRCDQRAGLMHHQQIVSSYQHPTIY